jgi:amidase
VLGQAAALDEERAKKGSRGPLHGIPVLVKDNFATNATEGSASKCTLIEASNI